MRTHSLILAMLMTCSAMAAPFDPPDPWVNVRDYGAVGDGVADDTAAIQAAIDTAAAVYSQRDSLGGQMQVIPPVFFPTGRYRVTSTLEWACSTMFGVGWNSLILWDGPSGGVVLHGPGGLSNRTLRDLNFRPKATNKPGCYLDLRGQWADWGGELQRVQFGQTTAPTDGGPAASIRTSSIVNAHWRDLRFDHYNGWAIHIDQSPGTPERSFSLDGFTIDTSFGTPSGFLRVAMGDTNSNLTIELANARLESNFAWSQAPAALVSIDGVLGIVPAKITLRNLACQIGSMNLVHQGPSGTASASHVVIENVGSGFAAVLSGTWSSAIGSVLPAVPSGAIAFWTTGRMNSAGANGNLVQLGRLTVLQDGSLALPNLTAFPTQNLTVGQLAVVNGKLHIFTGVWTVVGAQQ